MAMMPAALDNGLTGFNFLTAAFNKDLGKPNNEGAKLRAKAIAKLQGYETAKNWAALAQVLEFAGGLKKGDNTAGDPLRAEIQKQVYTHFETHWSDDAGAGYFGNITHDELLVAIGRGFLAALLSADKYGNGADSPLPIEILWVCSNPDHNSTDYFVEHVHNPREVIVVIATPLPRPYDPKMLFSSTDIAIDEFNQEKEETYAKSAEIAMTLVATRTAVLWDHYDALA
ncbi:MAG: hypothetical protein OES57_11685, partial [Acidimicrobiia bacterium]|nr:hypothetical protein [Acidimicrobiia bacterium]